MWSKIKAFCVGLVSGVLCVLAFILGKKLHDNGKSDGDVEGKLADCTARTDGIKDGINKAESGIGRAEERIADSIRFLDELEKEGGAR